MTLPMTPKRKREDDENRVYTCKTCNMKFSTFQALGGHRAGHSNRSKMDAGMALGAGSNKPHTCSFCFEKFVSGQALGGHMRKHREAMEKAKAESLKRKILFSENFKEDKSLQLVDSVLVTKSNPISGKMIASEGSSCNYGSTLVTWEFFPREPVRDEKVPVVIEQVLEEHNSWLDLKLGPSCRDNNKH